MDRIDLQVVVGRLKPEEMTQTQSGEPSEQVRQRVETARNQARDRFHTEPELQCNADMQSRHLRQWCPLDDSTRSLMEAAVRKLSLSARATDRILKVARTIADLEGSTLTSVRPTLPRPFSTAPSIACSEQPSIVHLVLIEALHQIFQLLVRERAGQGLHHIHQSSRRFPQGGAEAPNILHPIVRRPIGKHHAEQNLSRFLMGKGHGSRARGWLGVVRGL
jgi:hypothetical protein